MSLPSDPRPNALRRSARRLVLLGCLTAGPLLAPAVPAAEPRPALGEPQGFALSGEALDAATEDVASLMRCPVCQGLSIAASPVDQAVAMKQEVRELLAAGYTRDQILAYFERSYGEFIRLAPKGEGFNLFVWIAPVVALLLGFALVIARVRRNQRAAPGASPEVPPELVEYLERVRREVAS